MNPEEDVLLKNSLLLQDGMFVLIASSMFRVDLFTKQTLTPSQMERANTWNRWALVSDVDTVIHPGHVTFVATYVDDTKRLIDIDSYEGWFQKVKPSLAMNVFRAKTLIDADPRA